MKPLIFTFFFLLCFFSFNAAFAQPKIKGKSISDVLSRARGEILKGKAKAALKRMSHYLAFRENPERLPIPSLPLYDVAPNHKIKNLPKGILENARFLFALALLRTDYHTKISFIRKKTNIPRSTMKRTQLKNGVHHVVVEFEKQKPNKSIAALAELKLSLDPDSEQALNTLRDLAKNGTLNVQFWALLVSRKATWKKESSNDDSEM